MHPYLWIPLAACVASSLTAGMIFARDPGSRANRQLALLGCCTAFWAMCEVVWNASDDPEQVLGLVRLSTLAWVWLGPLCLHLFVAAAEERVSWAERALPIGYGLAGTVLVLAWTTDWLHRSVVRTSWGWAYEFGPLFPAYYALTLAGFGLGFWSAVRVYGRYASPAERSQGRVVLLALGTPLVMASLTDGLLPMLGVQLPRLGTISLAWMGGIIAWSYFHFGYSLLAPGRFAPEILESLGDGVILVRLNGVVRNVNRGTARLLGCPADAVRGLPLRQILPFVSLDPPQEIDDREGELCVGPDRRIPVSISSSLLRDKRGLPIGVVLIVRDLREVVALRHRLVTSGRLAAVGQLAAGIAHEINNPIAYVRSNLGVLREHWQALEKELADDAGPHARELLDEGHDVIAECLEGVDRAAAIVRDVKGFSHAGEGQRQTVDLAPLLDRVLRIAEPQLRGRVAHVERDYAPTPPVPCAPQELQQVFLNLVLNAAQAVRPEGSIAVRTGVEGDSAVIVVEDDGCGISPDVMGRIFDPFFTTKPVGEGTGLGLAISYQIVRNHGGEIRVSSEPGVGTRFQVRLPLESAA